MYVITGGGSGIGLALASVLASQGHEVLIIGRTISSLRATANFSKKIEICVADITQAIGLQHVCSTLDGKSITALVHNAGQIQPIESIQTVLPREWMQQFQINLFAPFRLTQRLLSQLKGGRVLNVSSGAAHFPIAGWSAYCSSKAALSMFTRCCQLEFNDPLFASVMPGIVATPMTASIRQTKEGKMDEKALSFHKALYQEDRLVKPETAALFLAWLLTGVNAQSYPKEWDIYDTSHHADWLISPHQVPPL